jgi:hypothetical protein
MLHASRSLPRKFQRVDRFGNVNGFTIDIARASAALGLEDRCSAEIRRLSRLRHAAIRGSARRRSSASAARYAMNPMDVGDRTPASDRAREARRSVPDGK